jgi:hypothetical protein
MNYIDWALADREQTGGYDAHGTPHFCNFFAADERAQLIDDACNAAFDIVPQEGSGRLSGSARLFCGAMCRGWRSRSPSSWTARSSSSGSIPIPILMHGSPR